MAESKQPTVDELEKKEEELFRTGPLSVLTTSVKSNSQVLINCRWAAACCHTRDVQGRAKQLSHCSREMLAAAESPASAAA